MKTSRKQISQFRRGRVSVQREVVKQRRIRDGLERSLNRNLKSLFGKFVNTRAFLYKEFGQFDEAVATRELQSDLFPALQRHYRRVFNTIYSNNNKLKAVEAKDDVMVFDRSVDLEPILNRYFRTRELILVGISTNMATRVRRIISQGRRDNLTLTEIARNVETKVRPIAINRAATIARTETHNAAGFASHEYYKQVETDFGSTMYKKWAATGDGRTRDAHRAMNAKEPIPMNEDFLVGGSPMKHTGDPRGGARNNVNCRCVIIYVDEQDVVLD